MKLQDRLPERITVNGRRYRVDLDFRNVLNMMDVLARDDLLPEAREYRALCCVMRRPPRKAGEALTVLRAMLFPESKKRADQQKITDFEQDADLIRAAFAQEYGINLYRDKLHWLEFSSLLAGLPEGSRYTDILGIRARPMPAPTKYNAEERRHLARLKAEYAVHMTDAEATAALEAGLRGVASTLLAMIGKQFPDAGGEDNG